MIISIPNEMFDGLTVRNRLVNKLRDKVAGDLYTNRSSDIENATQLALFLYVLNERSASLALLKLFYRQVKYLAHNTTLWYQYGCSLLLQAEIEADGKPSSSTLDEIFAQDISAGSRVENYEYLTNEGLPEALSLAEIETQKWQCEIYTGQILELLYFKHMLPVFEPEYFNDVEAEIAMNLDKVFGYLIESLEKKRVSSIDRLDIHQQ